MSDLVVGLAAIATAVVLAVQLRLLAVQARQDRLSLAQAMADQWNKLQDDWHVAVMVVRGPMSYYPAVDAETRVHFREAQNAYREAEIHADRALLLNRKLNDVVSEGLRRLDLDQNWDPAYVERL